MELRRFKIKPFLEAMHARRAYFTDTEIADMLDRAEAVGFDLSAQPSPLEDLTLAELQILVKESGQPS